MAGTKAELFTPSLWRRTELNVPEQHDRKCQDKGRNYTELGLEVGRKPTVPSPPLIFTTIPAG